MTLEQLNNLVKIGNLHKEPPNQKEFNGLVTSAKDRLSDVLIDNLSYSGRFDLAYNAAHALALAALRWHGYRSDNRYQVFQCLVHTVNMPSAKVRVFSLCHTRRNNAEYEGHLHVDEALLAEFIERGDELLGLVEALGAIQ